MEALSAVARRTWPLAAAGAGCVLAALWHPDPNGVVVCPLRASTGIWCPGCGMTRAALALGRFDVPAAWRFHPWALALALQFSVFAIVRAAGRTPGWARLDAARGQRLMWANIGALVALWAFRYRVGAIPF